MAIPPWKLQLQPASFNGVEFHVEVGARSSGRRNAPHEFPKKDKPYTEDMGRRARTFVVGAYIIGADFGFQRDALIAELERETNGALVLPTSSDEKIVVCDRYSVVERRERGGYCELEMVFIEAGQDPSTLIGSDTQSSVNNTVGSVTGSASSYLDSTLGSTFIGSTDITRLT
ncbi:DNA circularization N-terminal domain-containing protein [Bradyrhizobium japonicum]|uniref:DNA circularization N-terminal domain-containing protein n=1 Tax=Bradyrhizobium japonicum TaxID=375 RepID=UPI0003FA8627|nr:DNA circularization N-terminal domain-containing protein [Bradyrhizobium japonicum]